MTGARAKGSSRYTSAGALASRGASCGQGLLAKLLAGLTITSLQAAAPKTKQQQEL
jgi:hypothetical protein